MSKQDRQGARTVTDLERKYNFGQSFAEVMGVANESREDAAAANEAVAALDKKLDQSEIFDRLTGYGASQGIYRDNGDIYINASYIKSGEFLADLIKAGVIRSVDGSMEINLDDGSLRFASDDTDCGDLEFAYGLLQILDPTGLNRAMVGTVYDLNKHQYSYEMTVKAGTALAVAGVSADDDDVYFNAPRHGHSEPLEDYLAVRWAGSNGVKYLTTADSPMMADKFLPVTESADYAGCYTTDISGETEWLNPPMVAEEEYRTTERWNGKPVYVKMVDFGALPASGTKSKTLVSSAVDIIDWRLNLISGTGANHTIPWLASSTFEGKIRAAILSGSSRTLQISVAEDMSAYTATTVIKYIKE